MRLFFGLLLLLSLAAHGTVGIGTLPSKVDDPPADPEPDRCSDPGVYCARFWRPAG